MQTIPKPEFPRPERQRGRWLNLNGSWDFRLFPEGTEAEERIFAQDRAEYDRTIVVPFTWTCPLSEVEEDVAGIGWYRRTVRLRRSIWSSFALARWTIVQMFMSIKRMLGSIRAATPILSWM